MVAKKKAQRFDILISPAWQPMLRLVGVKPETAYAEVTATKLRVRFGMFDETFPLEAIEEAHMSEWPLWAGIGPRYVPGTVGMIGTYLNIVQVTFSRPQRWRVLFPLPFEKLFLSMKEPDEFIAALSKPAEQKKAA